VSSTENGVEEANQVLGEEPDSRLTETPPDDGMASVIGQQQQPTGGTSVTMEAENDEVFEDEPSDDLVRSNSPKRRGRRGRFHNHPQKSYWSSDDEESFIQRNTQVVRPKLPKIKPDGTPGKSVTFGRTRRSNKRRNLRAQGNDDDSISDEDAPQRTNPAIILNTIASPSNSNSNSSPDSKPPPISVVRTKNKSKLPINNIPSATTSPIPAMYLHALTLLPQYITCQLKTWKSVNALMMNMNMPLRNEKSDTWPVIRL
jgi:hypothetical protein